nr:serine hydrolase domain-containing protein [Nocardia spumae]
MLPAACAPRPPATVPSPAAGADASDRVRGDLDTVVRTGAVGAIATLTTGGSTTVATSGLADIAAKTAIPTDRPEYVRVGSITKTFTAAVVLQLVAEHRIALDVSVDTYLPGLLSDARDITVRRILGHRSGLPEPPDSPETNEYQAARDGRTFTPAQEIELALRYPLKFAPGNRFEYSNTNYIVAGMVIEAVTGHRYGDELRDRIFTPLHLSNTYLPATGEHVLRDPHPTGYGTVEGIVTDETRMEPSLPWASGAMVSTGADLNRFFIALAAGQIVPQAEWSQMLDGADMGNGDGMFYGLGVGYTRLQCGAQFVGNVGGVYGFSAIAGATDTGRAAAISYTGTPAAVDIRSLLNHALCE